MPNVTIANFPRPTVNHKPFNIFNGQFFYCLKTLKLNILVLELLFLFHQIFRVRASASKLIQSTIQVNVLISIITKLENAICKTNKPLQFCNSQQLAASVRQNKKISVSFYFCFCDKEVLYCIIYYPPFSQKYKV